MPSKKRKPNASKRRLLRVETLERRMVLDGGGIAVVGDAVVESDADRTYVPMMVAGDPSIDPSFTNATIASDPKYDGVGSLFMRRGRFTGYICTGTLISPTHVLTAGHCLDTNDDGIADFKTSSVSFFVDGNTNNEVVASALTIHPDYTGFNSPSVNDDIAIVTLSQSVTGTAFYGLYDQPVSAGTTFEMVGFGRSGNGVEGYTNDASLTVKRVGLNNADVFESDDEGVLATTVNEVWVADFDHPTTPVGYQVGGDSQVCGDSQDSQVCGASLGNQLEANLGGGDSGGPSFVTVDEVIEQGTGESEVVKVMKLAAINTFGFDYGQIASPKFGTGLGGILLHPYLSWIQEVMNPTNGGGGGDGGGGGGGKPGRGGGKKSADVVLVDVGSMTTPIQESGATSETAEPEDQTDTSLVARTDHRASGLFQSQNAFVSPTLSSDSTDANHGSDQDTKDLDDLYASLSDDDLVLNAS